MLGPGNTGRKLPNMPTITQTKPINKSRISIKIFLVILKAKYNPYSIYEYEKNNCIFI